MQRIFACENLLLLPKTLKVNGLFSLEKREEETKCAINSVCCVPTDKKAHRMPYANQLETKYVPYAKQLETLFSFDVAVLK